MKFTKSLPTLLTRLFHKKHVLVIVGPTASGKSSLAINIAKRYRGEIISCDSRQIYKGLEIFSGAVTPETSGGVKHHIVSCIPVGGIYSADQFVKDTLPIIDSLHERGLLPIVTGGTGFWAQALMYEKNFPPVEPDYQFRETLKNIPTDELFEKLEALDHRRAALADPHNRKRLIRALEVINVLGTVPVIRNVTRKGYSFTLVYLQPEKDLLDARIAQNVSQRIKQGLLQEAEKTLKGLTQIQVEELGLGFKHLYDLKQGKISQDEFVKHMTQEEVRYAKRQKTFFKKLFKKYKGKKVCITQLDIEKRLQIISSYIR